MSNHSYIGKTHKSDYVSNVGKLLDFHDIPYSMHELNSYSKRELKYLIHKYRIILRRVNKSDGYWYRTSAIY